MLISIIIPLYNKESYIKRTISSVLQQSYKRYELIIVNDGSTDNSADVVKTFDDERIKLVNINNGGVSHARNVGISIAKADWVSFLDADDEYEINFLQTVVSYLNKFNKDNITFVSTNYIIGDKSTIAIKDPVESGILSYIDLFKNQCSPANSSCTVALKKALHQIGGFPEGIKLFEDWTVWFKLSLNGDYIFINEPLAVRHITEGSVSKTRYCPEFLYHHASSFPRCILNFMQEREIMANIKKKYLNKLSRFVLTISYTLATSGGKSESLKMMRYVHLNVLNIAEMIFILRIFVQIIVPDFLKEITRPLRLNFLSKI